MFASQNHSPNKAPARSDPVRVDAAHVREGKHEHNRMWQALAVRPIGVQAKLSISQPGDSDEREADQIADRVMRMASPQAACSCSPSSEKVQRKCASCEEEERIQRKSKGAETVDTANVDHALSSPGRPLDAGTRSFMESRFGRDFSHVRVHDDSPSATSADSIHARAYTLGPHIVFGAGMYRPASSDGRHLLAHELVHTVQQASSGPSLQRDVKDFLVTQLQPTPEKRTEGMSPRFFFDLNRSDLRENVPEEAAELARLKDWAAAHQGQHVTLVGRASQEGSRKHNEDLAWKRVATVRSVLKSGGVIVDKVRIDMKFEQLPVEYRFYRSVEIVAGTPTCNNFTEAQKTKDVSDCEDAFTKAHERATKIVDAAMARLRPATDPPPAKQPPAGTPAPPRDSRDTVLNNHFPGIPRATLLPLFESIATRLGEVKASAGHTCNHRCASGCERAASAGAGNPVILCAPFYLSGFTGALQIDERVFALLHETTHSAVIPTTTSSVGVDVAYSDTRLFSALTGNEALKNTDSFVETLLLLAEDAGGAPAAMAARGTAPADTFRLTTPATEPVDRNRTARRALGFAESWLNYSAFWAPDVYDYLDHSLGSWDDPNTLGHLVLELWTGPFKLNHPGNTGLNATDAGRIAPIQTATAARGFTAPAPKTRATQEDRTRVAGIYDRLDRMHDTLSKNPLTIDPATSGDGSWSSAAGIPGLGTNVQLADSFFTSLSPVEQARHVIRLMARAMSDLGALWIESYVEAADAVHQYRKLGP